MPKLTDFGGLYPRVEDSLLAANGATVAQNCDLAYNELRSTKGGYLVNTMTNAPQSIYTDDGITFYSWPTDVNAVRCPMVADQFHRLYYTGDGGFKLADRTATRATGGVPSSSYLVGVPRPTVAPTLVVQQPQAINSSTDTIVFAFHYEYDGVKYQEQSITPTAINNTEYQFTPPAMTSSTPIYAFPVLRMTANLKADGSQVFDIYSSNSTLTSSGELYSLDIALDSDDVSYTATLTVGIKEADKETRAYVFVYRNIYNEQGPPSDPTEVITSPIIPVTVTAVVDAETGYAPIAYVDVFRTGTGTTIASYFYAGSISVLSGAGTYTFLDNTDASLLDEELSSTYYFPPPQTLVGLTALPNGILMAWKDNEVWFSEAFKPWAWNPENVQTLTHAVVGAIAVGTGAIITTTATPYMVYGVSPDSMTLSKINVDQAGVSKWSIAVVDGRVVFASNDGLVIVSGSSASLSQSEVFFTREVWRARCNGAMSSMRFAVWDGRLVVYSATNGFVPFMIRFDEADGKMTDLPTFQAACSFVSQVADQLYYCLGTGVYQFNGGAPLTATWVSRENVVAAPANYGFAQAVVVGTWLIQFFAFIKTSPADPGGFQVVCQQQVTDGITDFRLPAGFKSTRWKIGLQGNGRFRELRFSNTARELARG